MPGAGLGNQQQQQHTEALRAPVLSARSAMIARSRCDSATCCMPFSLRMSERSALFASAPRPLAGASNPAPPGSGVSEKSGAGEFGARVFVT